MRNSLFPLSIPLRNLRSTHPTQPIDPHSLTLLSSITRPLSRLSRLYGLPRPTPLTHSLRPPSRNSRYDHVPEPTSRSTSTNSNQETKQSLLQQYNLIILSRLNPPRSVRLCSVFIHSTPHCPVSFRFVLSRPICIPFRFFLVFVTDRKAEASSVPCPLLNVYRGWEEVVSDIKSNQ